MPYTTISSWARLIWDALESYRIDAEAVFQEAGLDAELLRDPNSRYKTRSMARLWAAAQEASGDPCFGLTVAEQWRPTSWHGLGFAWLASGTVDEALRRLVRYSAVLSTAADFSLVETETSLDLVLGVQPGAAAEVNAIATGAVAANVVHMCRYIAGADFAPRQVALPYDIDGCRQRFREFFRAPVAYDTTELVISMDPVAVHEPLSTANAELAYVNEKVVRDYLAQLSGTPTVMRVRARLIDGLSSGPVPAAVIANELNMSPRTLQRKLQEEGTSYSEVLSETRQTFALRLIQDRELSLSDITYLLGFSEVSSFSRSFKSWTGKSPRDWRRESSPAVS
jgi:AraC-like DNA-binding protein